MPRILVVESNPRSICDRIFAEAGSDFGTLYADVLVSLRGDVTTTITLPYEGETVSDMALFDGVAFTGSSVEWNTGDDRASPLAEVMRRAFASGCPVIGSCNGMQLAASVLGGVTSASAKGREDGLAHGIRLTEQGRTHPMMTGKPQTFDAPCTHRDEVERLPEGAVRLAGNAHSEVQAFAFERDGISFWGTQYHPEFPPGFLARYLASSGKGSPVGLAGLASSESSAEAVMRTSEIRNWVERL